MRGAPRRSHGLRGMNPATALRALDQEHHHQATQSADPAHRAHPTPVHSDFWQANSTDCARRDTACPSAAGTASALYRPFWPARQCDCSPRPAPDGAALRTDSVPAPRDRGCSRDVEPWTLHAASASLPQGPSCQVQPRHVPASERHRHNTAAFLPQKIQDRNILIEH